PERTAGRLRQTTPSTPTAQWRTKSEHPRCGERVLRRHHRCPDHRHGRNTQRAAQRSRRRRTGTVPARKQRPAHSGTHRRMAPQHPLSPTGTDQAGASRTQYANTPANTPTREETLRRTAPTAPGTPKPLTENQARNTRFKGMRNGKPHPLDDTTLGSSIPKSRSWTVTTSAPNRKGLTTDLTTQGKTTTTLVPLTPLLLPTIVTLILLSPLLVTIVRSSTSHKKELTGAPETSDSPPNIDTTPTELGYLCGGVRYAAETALAELYLRGKIRRENPNSPHFVLTEPENRTLTAQPVQDDIAPALPTKSPQKLPELL